METVKAVLLGLALAVAGAGVSGAVLTGVVPLFQTNAASEAPTGWEVLETFTGAADGAETGTLDLRTFWGNINVVGWDQDAYEITVLARGGEGGQRFSDANVEAVFEETRDDGLGLSLQVVRTGSYDLSINNDGLDLAVVAYVPSAISWNTAYVCSGMDHASLIGLREALAPVLGSVFGEDEEEDQDRGCIEGTPMLDMNFGHINVNDDEEEEEVTDIPFALVNLHGGDLMVHAQYADLAFENAVFQSAGVMTQYGSITGSLEAPVLQVMTQYGEVALMTRADKFDAHSQYGDLHLQVLGGNAGAYNVGTQYGEIVLGLAPDPDFGYDVEALTQYGEALILLDGEEFSSSEEEDDGATAVKTSFLPGFPGFPGFPGSKDRSHHGGESVSAKSAHFDSAPIQVEVKAWTQYGDVLVTNGEMPEVEEDEDHQA